MTSHGDSLQAMVLAALEGGDTPGEVVEDVATALARHEARVADEEGPRLTITPEEVEILADALPHYATAAWEVIRSLRSGVTPS
jgi:hypothetical protein